MRRYWIHSEDVNEEEIHFREEVFHHIFKVCRMKLNSKFEVIHLGQAYLVQVTEVSKKSAKAQILEKRVIVDLPNPKIHLYLSFSKWSTMDHIVEKAVELGVKEITPFFSEYSFISSPQKVSTNKIERWRKIVVSATQQCGRGDLMRINKSLELKSIPSELQKGGQKLGLFFYEGESSRTVKSYLKSFQEHSFNEVALVIGSEGGFSEQEKSYLESFDFPSLSFGEQILRVETACVALISIIKYEMILK